ncbi:HAD-IIA family hydrolase [Cryobacterium sp. MDB1-18-2]|uniref:HAD-IIA family hydrolase n=2 Tax=unclassified Cryobacterium TaxID=2649013 RepID=UPI00106C9AE2|nr:MULTISPECIES: HAD-IIA family hydrolase [unclassified Cryobacterium]TFB97645.1 HAD-IIA family hydrolase [Cryobacterium sp. MDB2-A-1]TFC03712.1 HAD-IIA family hydrolase [Cryobacterium sp. MDB2-33-2]TFC07766.1 HAD-IIA family hydrolase [Cryobacterium sp. MDB2-A-2]TFC21007.1 HAD-IIA family hydrolase [Cryobacterium sp. MDB2-10]TFC32404.1 HAD-IIA family hydrolase [Cryobacterium sp. MDB1-18-2]
MLRRRRMSETTTPLTGVDVVLADLDGVVYQGPHAIPFAIESLNKAAETVRVGYLTNNASRTDQTVADHLTELGLHARAEDIVTSPQAAVRLLAQEVPAGARILVIGGAGLVKEVEKGGFEITRSADDHPAAVIQGFTPELGWKDLAEAAFALHPNEDGIEIPWVATNTDWTIPVARGIAPGNGTLVAAVHSAVGRLPIVAGKPEVAIFDEAMTRFQAKHALFIGDRLDTDILGANRAGIPAVLVLTGIDKAKQALAAAEKERPRFILDDLRQLHEPYPETVFSKDRATATVAGASVRITGADVEIVAEGDGGINLLRAACAVIWASGRPVYGLNVPERLYLRR